jgi:hypothetical protein
MMTTRRKRPAIMYVTSPQTTVKSCGNTNNRALSFATHQTLVRICITKIAPNAVSDVPIVQDDSDWTCRSWVKEALVALQQGGAIDRTFDMDDIEWQPRSGMSIRKPVKEGLWWVIWEIADLSQHGI